MVRFLFGFGRPATTLRVFPVIQPLNGPGISFSVSHVHLAAVISPAYNLNKGTKLK